MTFIKIVAGLILFSLGSMLEVQQIGMWDGFLELGGLLLLGLGIREYFQSKGVLK